MHVRGRTVRERTVRSTRDLRIYADEMKKSKVKIRQKPKFISGSYAPWNEILLPEICGFSTWFLLRIFAIFQKKQKSIFAGFLSGLAKNFVGAAKKWFFLGTFLIPFCSKWFLPKSIFVHFRFLFFRRQKSGRQESICANTLMDHLIF